MPCDVCDDGERMCDKHFAEAAAYWKSYFGAALERPRITERNANGHRYGCECNDCMDEYRRLKR